MQRDGRRIGTAQQVAQCIFSWGGPRSGGTERKGGKGSEPFVDQNINLGLAEAAIAWLFNNDAMTAQEAYPYTRDDMSSYA